MNRNSLLAFLLIAITVVFFGSSTWNSFWYGTILKKPVPMTPAQKREHDAKKRAAAEQAKSDRSARAPSAAELSEPSGQKISNMRANLSEEELRTFLLDSLVNALSMHPDSVKNKDTDDAIEVVQIVEDTIIVETNRLIAAISTKGARIISLKTKDYAYNSGPLKGELIDLIPAGTTGGAQLSVNNDSFDDVFFTAAANGYTVVLEAKTPAGRSIQKTFTFADDTYKIGYAVQGEGIAGKNITVGWESGITDSESAQNVMFGGGIDKRRAHYSDGKKVQHFEMKKKDIETPAGRFRWVGMNTKYFFVALVADEATDADITIEGRDVTPKSANTKQPKDINYSIYFKSEAQSNEADYWIYAGPGRLNELTRHGVKFEKSLYPVLSWSRHIFWAGAWFPPLAELILKILLFFYSLVKDYGVAIFLLTLLSKVITFPMTQSSTKSMLRMKELQPKLVALRQKHKGNTQKMNEEMMALYKAEGVNPFNPGCLPMFLQMPIFIALFIVLRKAIELRGASSFLLPWVKDLSLPEAIFYLPGAGLPIYGNNVALMPIIMAALTFFQQKQAITDPNQKAMIYMMPIIMLVMFNSFPAGVVFYWTISSALGLVQQKWLRPKISTPATTTVITNTDTRKVPVKKSSGKSSGGKRKNK
jgi:YidC/Oxa1 family membrane protein insertase